MKVVIVRRVRGSTPSLDVYSDNLVAGLKTVCPDWTITEVEPQPWNTPDKLWMSGPGVRKYYECYWRYPKAISQMDADIFHIVDQTDAHIVRWIRKAGKPTVVTCHDLVQLIQPEKESRLPQLSLAVWRYSVRGMCQANQVVAVSSNTAKDIQRFLDIPSDRVTVALNGVEPHFRILSDQRVDSLRQQNSVSPDTICLLHVGGNHQRKNIIGVLQVLAKLKALGLPVCLWKVGEDFTPEQKTFIREHQLEKSIVHFKDPDKATLVVIYNAADILLSPSLYEGFGLTIVEAMACGTPVITSNVSSLPEVTGDAAILVDPADIKAMVDAVIRLSENKKYAKELAHKGLLRAQSLSWNKTAKLIAMTYKKALANK